MIYLNNRSVIQTNKKNLYNRGFSLIELIIVIAIMAVLTGILYWLLHFFPISIRRRLLLIGQISEPIILRYRPILPIQGSMIQT